MNNTSLLFFVAVLVMPGYCWAQANRCVLEDGRIVYSDIACPSSSRESKSVPGTRSDSYMSAPLPKKIVFSGNHRTDYIKASALMDSIRTLGRECEWALKVDKHKLQSCVTFLSKLGPGGEFAQITDHVTELNKNQEQAGVNIDEIRLLTRHLEAVVRYKEFALAKLEVSR